MALAAFSKRGCGLYGYDNLFRLNLHNLRRPQFLRIHDDVFDALSFPSVGDVHQAIARLNDGGIRKFAGLIFQHQSRLPLFAIVGNRHVEFAARGRTVVRRATIHR